MVAGSGGEASSVAKTATSQFIVGPENSLVRVLVDGVIQGGLKHNPIVLCGPMGVGKSTLAHLLAYRRVETQSLTHPVVTTGSDLARALAHAADTNSIADLRTRYHRCDLLLVDDAHRLAGKAAAQQFLATTVDILIRRGILVLVVLPQLPQEAHGLIPTLASRLGGGLVVPLAPPEALARAALVRQFAGELGVMLDDELVSCLATPIAKRNRNTIPQLRHAVMQIGAAAQAKRGISREALLNESLLADVLDPEIPDAKIVFRKATSAVAKHLHLTVGQLRGKSRQQAIAEARCLAMSLCRRLTAASYAEIGRHFGNRDHTTVLHACRKAQRMMAADASLARLVDDLANQISADESQP